MNTYALEMMLAVTLVAIGVVLAWPGDTFAIEHYSTIYKRIPEAQSGLILAIIGSIRVAAILRNGRTHYTPIIRILGCSIGAGFWASIAFSINVSAEASGTPLILPIALVATCFELYSAIRGGADAHALDSLGLKQRKAMRRQDATKSY